MKLCFICSEYPPGPHGGVGTMVQLLAREFSKAGHSVRVVGVYPDSYPAADHENDQGVLVWRLRQPRRRFGWVQARYQLYKQVREWARRGEVDIVEAPDSRGWFAGWPKMEVPLVQRANGSYTYFAHEMGTACDRMTRWLEARSYARADAWASVSRYTADRTRSIFKLKRDASAIIYNAIEPRCSKSEGQPRAPQRVVFTGTLVKKKGIVALAEGWRFVDRQFPQARLDIYGKDGRTPAGESMIAYLQREVLVGDMQSRVCFHGHVSRDVIYEALENATVAVFPSYAEAFAFAPLESMAVGCPTIYSTRGSGPELIRDHTDGLLVDPDDSEGIGKAIVNVLSDSGLANRLATHGRVRAEQFNLNRLCAETEQFFRDTIQRST